MSALLFEDMIRAETPDRVCRIWREVQVPGKIPDDMPNETLKEFAWNLMTLLVPGGEPMSNHDIVRNLVCCPRVNSVEVINKHSGDGVCVHKDWP